MSLNPWNDTMQHAIAEAQARITAVYPERPSSRGGEDPAGLSPMPTPTPRCLCGVRSGQ
jgi:hypothetical protein